MADLGRPPVIDENVLNKLEEVFALGGTDKEACLFAGISHQTLYNYQKNYPDFVERKEALKATPILLARRTVFSSLSTDVDSAWRYVERKDADLNPRTQIDHTTKGDKIESSEEVKKLASQFDEYLKQNNT